MTKLMHVFTKFLSLKHTNNRKSLQYLWICTAKIDFLLRNLVDLIHPNRELYWCYKDKRR